MANALRFLAIVALVAIGSAHARKHYGSKPSKSPGAGHKGILFPSLTSCAQKRDSTPFRVSMNITKAMPGTTWCFGFTTGIPVSSDAPCGKATLLDRVQMWASHDSRAGISSMRIRDYHGDKIIFGAWSKKGNFTDELVFSKLGWTVEYIAKASPHICLTLGVDLSLDALCHGPNGQCVLGLYSIGDMGAKCCPAYAVPVL